MMYIRTTLTAINKLKQRAKVMKKNMNLAHMEALEKVARDAGYESWHHVKRCHEQTFDKNP